MTLSKILLSGIVLALMGLFAWLIVVEVFDPESSTTETPSVQTTIETYAINDRSVRMYLEQSIFSVSNFGGKVFISYERLGESVVGSQSTVYIWALFQEYYEKDGRLEKGTGASVPLALHFKDGNPLAFNAPRDGSQYREDIQKIFPNTIVSNRIFTDVAVRDETVNVLERQNLASAREYFHIQTSLPVAEDVRPETDTASSSEQISTSTPAL